MAYALYDFYETEEISVDKTSLIVWDEDKSTDINSAITNGDVVKVLCTTATGKGKTRKTTQKEFNAHVVKVSGMCTCLAYCMCVTTAMLSDQIGFFLTKHVIAIAERTLS